jgi:hypothetical protein
MKSTKFLTQEPALNPADDDSVAAELEKFETDFDKEILSRKISYLRSIEWKYLRKTP